MKQFMILPLGTGNALLNDKGNFNSNFVVEYDGEQLFIDCGRTFPEALAEAGMDFKQVKHLYISHAHGDHAGGLEWLMDMNAFVRKDQFATTLYLAQEISYDINQILRPSMNPSIKGAVIDGLKACFKLDLQYARAGEYFKIGALKCMPVKLPHVDTYAKMDSYGLIIEVRGPQRHKHVFITSDTQFRPEAMMHYYESSDLILHDCWTGKEPSSCHASFDELATLPAEIKSKIFLYHYGPGRKPDAKKAGFAGYALPRKPIFMDP